jgi:hypothetical protein
MIRALWFKPTVAERDKKLTMTDQRGISTYWIVVLKPSIRISRLWDILELVPKKIAILTKQKISQGRTQK